MQKYFKSLPSIHIFSFIFGGGGGGVPGRRQLTFSLQIATRNLNMSVRVWNADVHVITNVYHLGTMLAKAICEHLKI